MARPSILLRWANAVTGSFPGRTEPNDGKKDVGFDDDEAPPAGEHNWIFGVAGDWITYLDGEATRLLNAALLAAVNVFARTLFVDNVDNEEALLSTTKVPQDSVTGGVAYPANTFKLLIDIPIDSGHCHLRFYVGKATDGSSPSLVITFNGYWSTNTNNWYADHSAGQPATALIIYPSSVEFRQHPVPAPTNWTTWPDHGDVLAGGDLTARGGVTALGDVHTAGDYDFTSLRVVPECVIDIADCYGDVFRSGTNGGVSSPGGGFVAWRLRLAADAQLGDIDVMVYQDSTAPCTLKLMQRTGADWGALPPVPPHEVELDSQTGPATVGVHILTLSGGGFPVLPATEEYQIRFTRGAALDAVQAFRMRNAIYAGLRPG